MELGKMRLLLPVMVFSLVALIPGCQKEPEMTREEYVSHLAGQVRSDSLKSYVRWLEGMGTRFALADNRRDVAVRIKKRFVSFGYPGPHLIHSIFKKRYGVLLIQHGSIMSLQPWPAGSMTV